MSFTLTSASFQPNQSIPRNHTCDGADVSPALRWEAPPAGTQSFALIVDDPDAPAGVWVHWVAYDIPGAARQLPEGVPKTADLQGGGRQGRNDFGRTGYGGPCPPPGKPHHYHFKLYAVGRLLGLPAGATKQEVLKAMGKDALAQAEIVGTYARSR